MKWKITAQAYNRKTNEKIGLARTETIDTETNSIFSDALDSFDVQRRFESFWNDTNPISAEIVKVIRVKRS